MVDEKYATDPISEGFSIFLKNLLLLELEKGWK